MLQKLSDNNSLKDRWRIEWTPYSITKFVWDLYGMVEIIFSIELHSKTVFVFIIPVCRFGIKVTNGFFRLEFQTTF